MNLKNHLTFLGLWSVTCLSVACSTTSLTREGRLVEVVGSDDIQKCTQIESFQGNGSSNFLEFAGASTITNRAISDAMNLAGKKGATHLVLGPVAIEKSGWGDRASIQAVSYRCPENAMKKKLIWFN